MMHEYDVAESRIVGERNRTSMVGGSRKASAVACALSSSSSTATRLGKSAVMGSSIAVNGVGPLQCR